MADLNVKARLYGSAGYAVYWVVAEDLIYEHTEPNAQGYTNVRKYGLGERIPVRYAGTDIAVDSLLTVD